MKGVHPPFLILILTMSCVVLMHGTSYAAAASQQTSAESSARKNSAKLASDRWLETHDVGHVTAADDGKRQKQNNSSDEKFDAQQVPRPASDKNQPLARGGLATAKRPKQRPNSRKRSISGNAMNLHQSASDKSRGVAKGGPSQNEMVNNARPARPLSVARPTTASLNPSVNNIRHRGFNAAVVGGSAGGWANLNSNKTGAINGTRMNRRP
jgi:hypothetical protein